MRGRKGFTGGVGPPSTESLVKDGGKVEVPGYGDGGRTAVPNYKEGGPLTTPGQIAARINTLATMMRMGKGTADLVSELKALESQQRSNTRRRRRR